MKVTIVPFSTDHLEPASVLLAARHRRDRVQSPDFSPEFEKPAATLPLLRDNLAVEDASGVVALRGAKVVGYLVGNPARGTPTQPFAGFAHPRAAEIAFAGHAVEPSEGNSLIPRLYAELARQWVANGLVGHYVTIPATPEATEPWLNLGFGRWAARAVRPVTPTVERPSTTVDIRRASAGDEEEVQSLVTELFRSFADPPIFIPFLPVTAAERRQWVENLLADPSCSFWLAFANDRLVGLQMFTEPTSVHWHDSAIESPPRSVYLQFGCTTPEARSMGIGAALFVRAIDWVREAGYDACQTHYATASRAAPFWRGLGFSPVSYELSRIIDERVTWAREWT